MPMEFVISAGTSRYLAHATWCCLAFFASNGAMAGAGAPAGNVHGGIGFVVRGGVAGAVVAYGVVLYSLSYRYLPIFPQERELALQNRRRS